MRRLAALLAAVGVILPVLASRYRTDLILGADDFVHDGSRAVMNNHGDVFFSAYTDKQHGIGGMFFNSTPYKWAQGGRSIGVNDAGDLLWEQHIPDPNYNERYRVMKNDHNLSGSTGWQFYTAQSFAMNQSGQVAWTGWFIEGGDLTFVDQTEWGAHVGIDPGFSYAAGLNDRGQLLWNIEGSRTDAYLDGVNLTRDVPGGGTGLALNNKDDIVWRNTSGLYVNQTDLTALYAPPGAATSFSALNQGGHVLWYYYFMDRFDNGVMLDGTNISAPIVAPGDGVAALGLNDSGDALWASDVVNSPDVGYGYKRVFVNGYDFTADVLAGQQYDYVDPIAINNPGQIFWCARINGKLNFYRSTPVPEPSTLLLGLPFIAALALRRKSAG